MPRSSCRQTAQVLVSAPVPAFSRPPRPVSRRSRLKPPGGVQRVVVPAAHPDPSPPGGVLASQPGACAHCTSSVLVVESRSAERLVVQSGEDIGEFQLPRYNSP